jgi:hypothetical protein
MRQREVRARHEHFVFFDANECEREITLPEREFSEQQERRLLEAAVAQLPVCCRLVFTLVELEGKPIVSVADHLQVKPEAGEPTELSNREIKGWDNSSPRRESAGHGAGSACRSADLLG